MNFMKLQIYINRDISEVIKAKQFDAKSRYLDVTLLDDNGTCYDLTNCRVQFNARKADGSYIMNNAAITEPENGRCLIELTDQTLALGNTNVEADIAIFTNDATQILTTRTFLIQVQTTVRNDEAIESSDEFNSVVTLFQDVWDMRETINSVNERFGFLTDDMQAGDSQAGTSALGALNKIWNYLKTQSTAGIVEKVNEIGNTLSSSSSSILGLLGTINTRGTVKSVQRGTSQMSSGSSALTVSINSVNPNKTIVLFDGIAGRSGGGTYYCFPPYLTSLTETSFSCNALRETTLQFSWQVVEFY